MSEPNRRDIMRWAAVAPITGVPALREPSGQTRIATLDPEPTKTLSVATQLPSGGYVTAIYREWAEGDISRCRLCDRCWASTDTSCFMMVNRLVPRNAAAKFSTRGFDAKPPVG